MTTTDFELQAFAETARRFAKDEIAPLVGTEGRDGRLENLPGLLDRAEEAGLLASPQPDSPGHDYGVWGRACTTDGVRASLKVLQALATECAGVAACLHFAGLGALEIAKPTDGLRRVAVAFFEDNWRVTKRALVAAPDEATRLDLTHDPPTLLGAKSLVHAPPDCQGYVVFAGGPEGETGWRRSFVPCDATGLVRRDPGQRSGLAAVGAHFLSFDRAACAGDVTTGPADPIAFLRRHMLGLSAIALGNAEGALAAATAYAEDRYQGGDVIAAHPAVQLLLGDSASRIMACAAHVEAASRDDDAPDVALQRATACRLRVAADSSQAVTDCLQVLGGYGYMEDYRLEKRLRDALTLKSMAPRPDDLRLLLANSLSEVGS